MPATGSHHRAAVCRSSGPGPSITAPTRIGRPAIVAAACTVRPVTGSRVGSMSVEFSGHRMKSGIGATPSRAFDHQVDGLAEVVVGDRPHPAEGLDPPARHVALHDADADRAGRVAGSQRDVAAGRRRAGPARRCPRRPGSAGGGRSGRARRVSRQHHRVRDESGRPERRRTRLRRRRSTAGSRPAACPRPRTRAGPSRSRRTGPGSRGTRSATSTAPPPAATSAAPTSGAGSDPAARRTGPRRRSAGRRSRCPSTWIQLIEMPSIPRP